MSKHTIKPADNQGVVTEQFPSNKQHSKHMDEASGEKDMMAWGAFVGNTVTILL